MLKDELSALQQATDPPPIRARARDTAAAPHTRGSGSAGPAQPHAPPPQNRANHALYVLSMARRRGPPVEAHASVCAERAARQQ